jgi:hypothetical protein
VNQRYPNVTGSSNGFCTPTFGRYHGTDTTNTNAYVVTIPNDFALLPGVVVWVVPSHSNTASPTLNVNGTGAKALVTKANVPLGASALTANSLFGVEYDGTSWRVFIS